MSTERERELEGVIHAIVQAWDIYDAVIESAHDSLVRLEREIDSARELVGRAKRKPGHPKLGLGFGP